MHPHFFSFLSSLKLCEDEKKVLRKEIDDWATNFLPKLKRTSTREEKCRLIASVDRHDFGDMWNARGWQFCKFVGNEGIIYDEEKNELERFAQTFFQKKILLREPTLNGVEISRWDILAEDGEWILDWTLQSQTIYEGGEAVVFTEKFGNKEYAVRVQAFEPFLFTHNLKAAELKLTTHIISGWIIFFYFVLS